MRKRIFYILFLLPTLLLAKEEIPIWLSCHLKEGMNVAEIKEIRKNKDGVFFLQYPINSPVSKTFSPQISLYREEFDGDMYLEDIIDIYAVFIDGRIEGLWREKGYLTIEETYKNGLLHGIRKVSKRNGELYYETVFENGTGLYRNYYREGQLLMEGKMESGQREGTWKYYNWDGFCIKIENYKRGMLDGNFQVLDTLGNTLYKTEFVNGTGLYKSFTGDGKLLLEEGQMENGLRIGEWTEYDYFYNHGTFYEDITKIQYDKNIEEKKKKNLIREIYVGWSVIYLLAADEQ